jgi:hypothetical protein
MKPLKVRRKRLLTALSLIGVIVLLFFGTRYLIFRLVQKSLSERISAIRKEGIFIAFDSMRLDAWNGHILVTDLKLILGKDSVHSLNTVEASTRLLLIKEVEIIPFILERSLNIRDIAIYDPRFIYRNHESLSKNKNRIVLDGVHVQHLRMMNASLLLKDSTAQDTTGHLTMNIDLKNLAMRKQGDSLAWRKSNLTITDLKFTAPHSFYTYSILQAHLNLEEKIFDIDSLRVIPNYDRVTFARKANKQVSRLDAVVPRIAFTEFELGRDDQLHIDARKLTLTFHLDVFRDKRYPLKRRYAELPVEFIQKLPFQFQVDTIAVEDSFVRYEEFPAKGDSTGYVFFENINSTIVHAHNRASKEKADETKMFTTAKFMGKGELKVTFTYPADTLQPYKTMGSLKNFPMSEVNTILIPGAKTKIETGIMRDLKFHFSYNKYRSDGNVELNYKDLKVISLKEDKNHEPAVSGLKTFLLNALKIKKNVDENSKADDREGTILFYRDTRRGLFHYWWQSLFSGIKSAYKLDNLLPSKTNSKKEMKKEKRKARKLKRRDKNQNAE